MVTDDSEIKGRPQPFYCLNEDFLFVVQIHLNWKREGALVKKSPKKLFLLLLPQLGLTLSHLTEPGNYSTSWSNKIPNQHSTKANRKYRKSVSK